MNNNEHLISPFPATALPKAVADMCSAVSENMQVPLELPCTVALGVLAACCQKKAIVRIGADYFEPLNLFTLAIAQSGERKSPVFRILTAPVYTAQDEYIARHADEISQSQLQREMLEEQLREAKRKDNERAFELNRELLEFKPLVAPKLLLDDVTSQKLIDVLEEQGGNITIASAESGIFIDIRNQAMTSGAFDVYLKAYSGDSIDVKRIGRVGNSIKNPHLSLVLTAQSNVAKDMINNKTFRDKGLPARFLYALCTSNLGNRCVDNPDIPVSVKCEYDALIRRLLDNALDREMPSCELMLSADGRAAYHDYSREVEAKLGADGEFSHMTDWGAKLVGHMLRIAGIIAVCEGLAEVDSDVIERASNIADWFAVNADVLFSKSPKTIRARAEESDSEYLLRKLLEWDSSKDLTVSNARKSTQNKKNFDFESTLTELKSQGHIRITKQGKREIITLTP